MSPLHGQILLLATAFLSGLCFITGGSSQEAGTGVMVAQVLAIPVLLYALWQADRSGRLKSARWSIALVLAIVSIPALQLLPLPTGLWNLSGARSALQQDLAMAGVVAIEHRWSLAPGVTERALWSLLPALALFFSALALRRDAWRGLLWCVIALVAFSCVLAFVQIGAPQDSFVNPFPQYAAAMAGVFANRNHQSSALAIGLVLAAGLLLPSRRQHGNPAAARVHLAACVAAALLFALLLPLVGSRAGGIVALVALGVLAPVSGLFSLQHLQASRAMRWAALLAAGVLIAGIYGALAWMQVEADIEGSRWEMAVTTARLGLDNAPLGSGIGSFIAMFEQATRGAMMKTGYVNAAHDEYAQWWFEGGVAAVIVMLAVLAFVIVAMRRVLQLPARSTQRVTGAVALTALLVLLLHSMVDYPLRTPALMAMAGLLAGILVATTLRVDGSDDHDRKRSATARTRATMAPANPPREPWRSRR